MTGSSSTGNWSRSWPRSPSGRGYECVVKSPSRGLVEVFIPGGDIGKHKVAASDGSGDSDRAITAVWAQWMSWAIPRMRSAVLATRPIRPFPHQDDAVFGVMLSQPRLRFLLADEPGTGKTLMTGMYLAEGRRRGLIPGKTVIVVPAHLVEKWIRELRRFFGIEAHRVTAEIGRDPLDLRDDVDVWVVSVDLYTYNSDVRRKIVGSRASWSLAVFDEAHRLTPTSQYLGAAGQLADQRPPPAAADRHARTEARSTTSARCFNLLDPAIYPWDESAKDYAGAPLRPGRDNFLRRMKEDLRDLDGKPAVQGALRRDARGAPHAGRVRRLPGGHGLRRHLVLLRLDARPLHLRQAGGICDHGRRGDAAQPCRGARRKPGRPR